MNKIQIKIFETKIFQGTLKGPFEIIISHFLNISLCSNKKLIAAYDTLINRLLYSIADSLFVFVLTCGIYQTITGVYRVKNSIFTFRFGYLKYAESLRRHFNTIEKFYSGNINHESIASFI